MSLGNFIRSWTGKNAILLAYDHLDDNGFEAFESQITDVAKYFKWNSLSGIVQNLRGRSLKTEAALLFLNPRKSVLLRGTPLLESLEIPYTIALRADCIGLNRLPLEEEMSHYQKAYPEYFAKREVDTLLHLAWESPEEMESFLKGLRKELGPLPIPNLDPMSFFATWGKLNELNRNRVEFALNLFVSPNQRKLIDDGILFMRHQLGVIPKIGVTRRASNVFSTTEKQWEGDAFAALGLEANVGEKIGDITKRSDCYDLPVWHF